MKLSPETLSDETNDAKTQELDAAVNDFFEGVQLGAPTGQDLPMVNDGTGPDEGGGE